MANRLADETSPYLLQHKDNPVDWYPWGEEALLRARDEDKPILLSIGYSACHWCHVMERESFEDAETGNIKRDEIRAGSGRIVQRLSGGALLEPSDQPIDAERILDTAVERLR